MGDNGQLQLLLVETMEDDARGLVQELQRQGYANVCAHSGEREGIANVVSALNASGRQLIAGNSERRKLEAHIRHAQKMEVVGQLTGGLVHDLNNILTVIFAYGDVVTDALPADHDCRDDVDAMLAAARKAGSLTSRLLAFSRKKQHRPRTIEVNPLVRELDGMLSRLMGDAIVHELDLDPNLRNVHIDPDALEQVLLNMAINARDAMPRGGTFRLTTRNTLQPGASANGVQSAEVVSLRLTDTGEGMDDATMERVFEPFFTTKGPDTGTGLGLSMCFGIIAEAGGEIRVESAKHRGTTFEIILPAIDLSIRTRAPKARPAARAGDEQLLLVEDDPDLRQATRQSLTKLGYRVTTIDDPRQALVQFAAEGPDCALLITDLAMPGLGGRELARRWKVRYPNRPVLFVSGRGDMGQVPEAASLEHALLRKPFTRDELGEAVRDVLDGVPANGQPRRVTR